MQIVRLRLSAKVLFLSASLIAGSQASAQTACEVYTVAAGDTLSLIAERAKVPGGYQILFSANEDVLTDPTDLQIGMRLKIPCADGSLPGEGRTVAAAAAAPAPAPSSSDGSLPPIRFLTGGNFAPFTDESLPNLGLFSELVVAALEDSGQNPGQDIIFINDWDSHLSALLPSGAFDMGFPWHMPDCADTSLLSPANAIRCTDYIASAPFFEAVVGFYTMPGSAFAEATSTDDLKGARICRPEGWFTFDLEEAGLTPPAVELMNGRIPSSCWRALSDNKVDVVTYDTLTAEEDLVTLGMKADVAEIAGLSSVATMHVLVPKSHPNGQAYVDLLNRGLDQMRSNGQWFAIVSKHLSDHGRLVGTGN